MHVSERAAKKNVLFFLISLSPCLPPVRVSLSLQRSFKAPGWFSEATGAGGIRVELDYTAKGYIYRARMYAEARTSVQRGRPCGFSLDANFQSGLTDSKLAALSSQTLGSIPV